MSDQLNGQLKGQLDAESLLSAIDTAKKEKAPVKVKKVDNEVEELKAQLREEISKAGDLTAKLRATYALQDALNNNAKNRPTPGLTIIGSFNEPDPFETMVKQYAKPGNHYRWANSHPTIYDFRRSRGYAPVLDDKGEKVTIGDSVLVHMPEKQYYEKIVTPKMARKTAVRKAIVNDFKDAAHEDGVKVFGKIQYDDGEVVSAGEDNNE